MKNVAQKNLIIRHLQIDILPTQKLELPYHELSCLRLGRKNSGFFLLKIDIFINLKANLLKKSQISFSVVNIKHQNDTKTGSIC